MSWNRVQLSCSPFSGAFHDAILYHKWWNLHPFYGERSSAKESQGGFETEIHVENKGTGKISMAMVWELDSVSGQTYCRHEIWPSWALEQIIKMRRCCAMLLHQWLWSAVQPMSVSLILHCQADVWPGKYVHGTTSSSPSYCLHLSTIMLFGGIQY